LLFVMACCALFGKDIPHINPTINFLVSAFIVGRIMPGIGKRDKSYS